MSVDVESDVIMRNPRRWIQYPYLPIKRYVEGQNVPEVAYLIAHNPLLIVRGNFFTVMLEHQKVKSEEITIEKVLEEGWIVD